MRQFSKFIYWIYVLLLFNCITPTEIKVENKAGQLVISGRISTLDERTVVQVGLTKESQRPIPISGAAVSISNTTNNEIIYFFEDAPGKYVGFNNGVANIGYVLKVELPTGETYESELEVTPETSIPVKSNYEFISQKYVNDQGYTIENNFVSIYASAFFPSDWDRGFISWEVEEVYIKSPTDYPDPFNSVPPPCYIRQKAEPNRFALLDGSHYGADNLEHFLVCNRIVDHTFLERHYFNTYQSTITREAFQYLSQVNVLANQTGSIFDTPPARVKGNIKNVNDQSEEVFGYFMATNETYDRIFLVPGYFPYPLPSGPFDCTFRGYIEYSDFCNNCLLLKNSSYNMPVWFGH